MEGNSQDGAGTLPMEQQLGDVLQQELLPTTLREDNTPATAISIHTKKKVDGRPENFHRQALQSLEGAAGSSVRVYTCLLPNKTNMYFLTHTLPYRYA